MPGPHRVVIISTSDVMLTIRVRSEADAVGERQVRIAITDTGEGIPADRLG
jgi:signal transduction histidine kinase